MVTHAKEGLPVSTLRPTLHDSEPFAPLDLHCEAFLLDLQAARYTPKTMTRHKYTLGTFVAWLRHHGVNSPQELTARHIKPYLVQLQLRKGAQIRLTR